MLSRTAVERMKAAFVDWAQRNEENHFQDVLFLVQFLEILFLGRDDFEWEIST